MRSPDADLERFVDERLRRFRRGLGPMVGAAFDSLDRRLRLTSRDGPGYFFADMALPIAQLPLMALQHVERLTADLGAPTIFGERDRGLLVESSVTGYLCVRAQDDLIDEALGRVDEMMLLADAFSTRHQAAMARVVGEDERFWAFFEQTWRAYGEAMLLEARLRESGGVETREDFDAVLERSMPLAIPLVAVHARAQRWSVVEELREMIWHLVTAHQLFHDLLDAEKDFAAGSRTYVLSLVGAGDDIVGFRRALYVDGFFDSVAAAAARELSVGREIAESLDFEEMLPFFDDRASLMREIQQSTYRAFFEQLLANNALNK